MSKSIWARSKPEHILCAAIHYPNDKTEGIVFQPKNIEKGIVLSGWRHHNVINLYFALTGKKTAGSGAIQGFLTSLDRFVDREEAFQIALKTKQIAKEQIVRDKQGLDSYDLY